MESATQPISVIIPCYNAEYYLKETLDSVFAQTLRPAEIIVVDDGSTDSSAEIASSYGSDIKLIQQPNQGESVARNRAIQSASSPWVALLDADDLWEPTKLEKQLEAVEASEGVVCVYTDVFRFNASRRLEIMKRPDIHRESNYRVKMLCNSIVTPSSAIIKTDVARSVRFDEAIHIAEDMIFFAQVRDHGRFVRVQEPLTGYRISTNQQSNRSDHGLRAVESVWDWVNRQGQKYSSEERDAIRKGLGSKLLHFYQGNMIWRDESLSKHYRDFYVTLSPEKQKPPLSMRAAWWSYFLATASAGMRWLNRMIHDFDIRSLREMQTVLWKQKHLQDSELK